MLIDLVKNRLLNRKKDAKVEYVEILKRADEPQAGDDERLETLCMTLGRSVEDAARDADTLKRVEELKPIVATIPARVIARRTANENVLTVNADTEKVMAAERAKQAEAFHKFTIAHGYLEQGIMVQKEFDQLADANKWLLN